MPKVRTISSVSKENLNIALLKANFTHQDLANEISKRLNKPVSSITVGAWTVGNRNVPRKYIACLAAALNCSIDFLLGRTDDIHGKAIDEPTDKDTNIIEFSSLEQYDNKPIWVEFIYNNAVNGWAILDYSKRIVIMKDKSFKISKSLMLYYKKKPDYAILNPYANRRKVILTSLFYSSRSVFVEYNSADTAVNKLYSGWYRHNENHTALINNEGLVLSYKDLNVSYEAFDFA